MLQSGCNLCLLIEIFMTIAKKIAVVEICAGLDYGVDKSLF